MTLLVVLVALLILLPAAAVFALNRLWPDKREATLAFTAGLIPPAIIGIFLIVMLRSEARPVPRADEIDSTVLATIMAIGPIMVLASIAVAVPAAMITLRHLRKRAGR